MTVLVAALLLSLGPTPAVQKPFSPRLYAVYFPNRPPVASEREMALAAELGFAGLRYGYDPKDLVGADNVTPVSPWAQRWIDADIARIKRLGLKVHLGLGGETKSTASDSVNDRADQWVADRYAAALDPGRLSFHLTNEPTAWHEHDAVEPHAKARRDDVSIARWQRLLDYLERYRTKGYKIFGPTFEGGFDWTSPRWSVQLSEYSRYLSKVVETPEYRQLLFRTRQNFHLYVPNTADAAARAKEKALLALDRLSLFPRMRNGFAITECNVRPDSAVSEYETGQRQAALVKALLDIPQLEFVTLYSVSVAKGYSFIDPEGKRNEERIRGWNAHFTVGEPLAAWKGILATGQ